MNDDLLIISAPIYLIGMNIECWKYGKKMPVVALLAPDIEGSENEVCILSNIVSLPEKIRDYVKKRVPTFQQRYSKTVKDKYYANVCPNCGMLSGDFFLHSEPGAPFFPTSEHEAALLYLTTIPADGKIQVQAGVSMGVGELILEHAKRIA